MLRTAILVAALVATVPSASLAAKPPKPPKPGAAIVSLGAQPATVVFGKTAGLTGALSTKAVGVTVTLQSLPAPFTGSYRNVTTAKTGADGSYSFANAPDRTTRYRVVAKNSPSVTSPVVTVAVAFRVSVRVSDATPRRGQRVSFSGASGPGHAGGAVLVQRHGASGWRTVSRTRLVASTPLSSTYRVKVRVGASARCRVRVAADSAHVAGTSRTRRLVVH
jgi:hypothetical protein